MVATMSNPVNKAERAEDQDQIADPDSIPDKLTGEEPGKEEEDSGAEPRGLIVIPFRQPIYSSNTGPRFPQELIERICELLWDEPVQLAVRCTRICPAWYHAAQRVLSGCLITCRTREALQDHAHTLTSRRNAPYRKRFEGLYIFENARKPFAHVWPMFIPGSMLPELESVDITDFDWSTKTPHDSFFIYLSSYTSVSRLALSDCRFRSLPDLRRVINALPNLTSLDLHDVMLQHPLRPGSVPDYIALRARSHKLQSIALYGPEQEHPDVSSDYLGTTALNCQALLHMVAANSFTVTKLKLDLRFFTSALTLWHWLAQFCRLTSFEAQYQFASSPMIALEETVPVRGENTFIHSWSEFILYDIPDQSALQLLQLLVSPESCSKLQDIQFYLPYRPSAALISCTSRVLRAFGHQLRNLTWRCSVDPDIEVTPSLAGYMSLQTLDISLRDVTPSPQNIHRVLSVALSDIVSVDLQDIEIWFDLAHLEVLPHNHGRTTAVLDPAESISAFHTILSREIFNGLPLLTHKKCVRVIFDIGNIQDNPTAVATIKAFMITLFTPWLDRRIVGLDFRSSYEWETITSVPTSELREDASPDHGGEDVEESTLVGTKL